MRIFTNEIARILHLTHFYKLILVADKGQDLTSCVTKQAIFDQFWLNDIE